MTIMALPERKQKNTSLWTTFSASDLLSATIFVVLALLLHIPLI